jgi:hypothetical protein
VLSGPAPFALLALIIAFAVYLRQVSNRAMDTIASIHARREREMFPPGEKHTTLKLDALRSTHNNLEIAAPFMIFLIVAIVSRITIDVLARFPNPLDWGLAFLVPLIDLVIMVWVCLLFGVLGLVHFSARGNDTVIRKQTDEFIASQLGGSEISNTSPTSAQAATPALSKATAAVSKSGQALIRPLIIWAGALLLISLFSQQRKQIL